MKKIAHFKLACHAFFNHYSKVAGLKDGVKLKEHQERAVQRIMEAPDKSLLAAHATGSGKTLTGIAAFEKLKETGNAKKAIVVVPSSLRTNFVENGVKRFTDSSVAVYGPKNESSTKNIGDKSNATYNVVSYDLFREHGDKILEDTDADTLIMDEIHKVRSNEGATYSKIKELRPKFKQAITLTGSVVNNEPNEVVPLLDITFKPQGHKLISKDFFDRTFVDKKTVTKGLFNPKVYVEKNIKNKDALSRYLGKQIDYVGHEELDKFMPKKKVSIIEVPMSKEQSNIYHYTLSSVDPITRWKISNNIPVGQREAQDAFSKLTQARQVSTDPSILSEELKKRSILEVSPKVKKIVDDAEEHLKQDSKNKIIIYGNLITGQLEAVEKGLKEKGIDHTKFLGVGNEGSSAKQRDKNIKEYMGGGKRVILISGAGAEGLDLKGTTLMQMVEGHYNPERIHQAESRARRLGSPVEEVHINRYVSKPSPSTVGKLINIAVKPFGATAGDSGVDSWIYSIADRKDTLNKQFKEVLTKKASVPGIYGSMFGALGGGITGAGLGLIARGAFVDQSEPMNKRKGLQKLLSSAPLMGALIGVGFGGSRGHNVGTAIGDQVEKLENMLGESMGKVASGEDYSHDEQLDEIIGKQKALQMTGLGRNIGDLIGSPVQKVMTNTTEKEVERAVKQKFLDLGKENLTAKRHYDKVLAESGISQRAIDLSFGMGALGMGLPLLGQIESMATSLPGHKPNSLSELLQIPGKMTGDVVNKALGYIPKVKNFETMTKKHVITPIVSGALAGLLMPIAQEYFKRKLISGAISSGSDAQLTKGINRYEEKLRKKMDSKYKTSKTFINEYDVKKELGIDIIH